MFNNSASISFQNLFFNPPTDFGGRDLRASAFPFAPYSNLDFETGNHGGTEFQMAHAIAEGLNMEIVVTMPNDGYWWGDIFPNGSTSGKYKT